jgi:metal-sulfur cluster biosynthetic enzyme
MSATDAPGATEPGIADPTEATGLERELWDAIDEIPDPHMPVSIVELGMVYDVRIDDGEVEVDLTFPCMGCPAYGMIQDDIRACLRLFDGVDDVTVNVVWDPVWTKDRLTDDVREKMENWGIAL